jgi:hypothetical protein
MHEDRDPLELGYACPDNAQCRPRPAPTRQNPQCPEWSRCEITSVLELNKDLFNPCWREAFGAPAKKAPAKKAAAKKAPAKKAAAKKAPAKKGAGRQRLDPGTPRDGPRRLVS